MMALCFGLGFVLVALRLRGSDGKLDSLHSGWCLSSWKEDRREGKKHHPLRPRPDGTVFVRFYFALRVMLLVTTNLFHPIQFKYAALNASLLSVSSMTLLVMLWNHPPYMLPSSNAWYAGGLTGTLWANLCALLVVVASQYKNKDHMRNGVMIAFYAGAIPSVFLGHWAHQRLSACQEGRATGEPPSGAP